MTTYATVRGMTPSTSGKSVPEWSLADRIRKIRRDRHMTQEQFAKELGIKPVTLASWESGRNHPEDVIDLAVRIERRFDVPAAWVLGVLNTNFDRRGQGAVPAPRNPRRRWDDAPMNGPMMMATGMA